MSPGDSTRITLQFGANTDREDLKDAVEDPNPVETEPPGSPATDVSAFASVFSFVPGLSEDETTPSGDDMFSAFPNRGSIPGAPIDQGFLGDQTKALGETVKESLEMRKEVEGLDEKHRQYRVKNSVAVSFKTKDGASFAEGTTVELKVNRQLSGNSATILEGDFDPEDFSIDVGYIGGSPEPLSKTVLEENINKGWSISAQDAWPPQNWGNDKDRTKVAYENERFMTATFDRYQYRGTTVDGVRVSTLYGGQNPYTRGMANTPVIPPEANPIIYHWIELLVLANGAYGVIVHDTTTFPKHTLFTGPAGEPEEQYKRTDSGLEIIYDASESTSREYKAAINDKFHAPWRKFFKAFEKDAPYVPYKTPKKKYMKKYDKNTVGRLIGYVNEALVDHPIMMYGESPDGEQLSNSEVQGLLGAPQTPYPGIYPHF